MKQYWSVYKVIFNNAVSYEAQYRRDTWLHLVTHFLWVGLLITTIEVIFRQTPTIMGWEKPEMYLLTLLWLIVDEIYTMVAKHNVAEISATVTDGTLDFVLTKPINTLFLVSTGVFLIRALWRLLMHLALLVWLVNIFDFAASFVHISITFLLVLLGVLIHYAFSLILNTMSFWWLRIDNINDAWESINNLGRYPLTVLPKMARVFFFSLVPIAFIGYLPTAVLTGRAPWYLTLYAFLFTAGLLALAIKFWQKALRRYSSASS